MSADRNLLYGLLPAKTATCPPLLLGWRPYRRRCATAIGPPAPFYPYPKAMLGIPARGSAPAGILPAESPTPPRGRSSSPEGAVAFRPG
jgi:hypothetical protein